MFKEIFSTEEAQQDLVWMVLPPEITARFRIETVGESGQETASDRMDLLLTVETIDGTSEYVYVLVEHKSFQDRTVAVQLLGYVAGIMKKHEMLPVPVVHPVVFYHGKQEWAVPTELTELHELAGPDAPSSVEPLPPGGYPVSLRYHLFDLSTIPPEQIAERSRARAYMGMIIMKYALQPTLTGSEIRLIAKVVVRSQLPEDLQDTMTVYFYRHVPERYKHPLMTAIDQNVYTEQEERRMRSIADALQEEGLMKGIEKGKADVLVRQLRRRFGLTAEEEAVVRDCHDAEQLDEAAEACVDPELGKDEILGLLM